MGNVPGRRVKEHVQNVSVNEVMALVRSAVKQLLNSVPCKDDTVWRSLAKSPKTLSSKLPQ